MYIASGFINLQFSQFWIEIFYNIYVNLFLTAVRMDPYSELQQCIQQHFYLEHNPLYLKLLENDYKNAANLCDWSRTRRNVNAYPVETT